MTTAIQSSASILVALYGFFASDGTRFWVKRICESQDFRDFPFFEGLPLRDITRWLHDCAIRTDDHTNAETDYLDLEIEEAVNWRCACLDNSSFLGARAKAKLQSQSRSQSAEPAQRYWSQGAESESKCRAGAKMRSRSWSQNAEPEPKCRAEAKMRSRSQSAEPEPKCRARVKVPIWSQCTECAELTVDRPTNCHRGIDMSVLIFNVGIDTSKSVVAPRDAGRSPTLKRGIDMSIPGPIRVRSLRSLQTFMAHSSG